MQSMMVAPVMFSRRAMYFISFSVILMLLSISGLHDVEDL
jgi:hypothetical protein